ncbi:hypothetical protein SLS60_005129 [Paraconiothyrium brasiliense]|uniref:Polyketide cyclase n=1 Tax=Paraconiothyrium brasiliense TaxID=300254 RepID=A0ABR3RGJ8_9PLEO
MVVYKVAATPIEIAAPPERVRDVVRTTLTISNENVHNKTQFLDFAKLPEWHTGHFKSIVSPAGKLGKELQIGDTIRVDMGINMNPVVVENSPERFVWDGGWRGVLVGTHYFEFQASKVTPGHTTFVNREDFSGWFFAWNFSDGTRKAGPGFDVLNRDLKRRVQSLERKD